MPASRLPAPNGPDFTRLAPLFLKIKNGSKNFYELLRPISTHIERPSNFIKILLVLIIILLLSYLNSLSLFGALKLTKVMLLLTFSNFEVKSSR